jgi:hypothetical protein
VAKPPIKKLETEIKPRRKKSERTSKDYSQVQ